MGEEVMFRDGMRILVALGFIENYGEVLGEAVKLAKTYNGKIYVIHVIAEVPTLSFYDDARSLWNDFADTAEEETLNMLHGCISGTAGGFDNIEPLVETGDPCSRILSRADELDIDLIVMGHHVRRGINHFIHNNCCEKVQRYAKRPILSIYSEE